jgi:WhiB family redox-sensing transcriptional regulator
MSDLLETDWVETPAQLPTLSALEQIATEAQMAERARLECLMAPGDAPEPSTLLDIFCRPACMAEAACRGMGAESFFPERGVNAEAAKAVCTGCPVRDQCLEVALSDAGTVGNWGGLSDRGRKVLRRGAA